VVAQACLHQRHLLGRQASQELTQLLLQLPDQLLAVHMRLLLLRLLLLLRRRRLRLLKGGGLML